MNGRFVGTLLAAFTLAAVAPAAAQVFTPSFQAPVRGADVGIYLEDGFPGSDELALEAILRRSYGAYDLGFRLGVADQADDLAVLLGADYRNPLELPTAPLALAVTGGLQAIVGDFDALGAQVGLSVGATFGAPQFRITPYLHPRVAYVNYLDVADEEELDLLADAGFDLSFAPNLTIRLGVGLGNETTDFGIGLAWR